MKIKLVLLSFFTLLFVSCIKDEPLGREADIVSFKLEGVEMVTGTITNDKVQFVISDKEDFRNLTPLIELSPGATISPESGMAQDFSQKIIYTVTSEDKKWKKEYEVTASPTINYKFDFEEWVISGGGIWKYPALKDVAWSSANSGIMLAKAGKVDLYPTRDTTLSVSGEYAAVLQTQKGGTYWGNFIPIFSGSLFLGVFTINMNDFVKSTKFGQIHPKENGKPIMFTGFYKYSPGKEFIDKTGAIVSGKTDECSVYAILYKVTKGEAGKEEYLDGTNIQTSDKVVAKAILEDTSAKNEFTEFSIQFEYVDEINYDLYDYKLAVVFASSKDGAFYEGAPGSMLIVDEVEVVCVDFEKLY